MYQVRVFDGLGILVTPNCITWGYCKFVVGAVRLKGKTREDTLSFIVAVR